MTSEFSGRLQRGIEAVRTGANGQARQILSSLVLDEPENVAGWLWLSSAVETDRERRFCLTRVLELEPENQAARRGLAKLGAAAGREPVRFRKAYPPISPAAALLYPDSQVREWDDEPLTERPAGGELSYQPQTSFDDVWSQDVDLCAYCAQPIDEQATSCPNCGRQLWVRRFQYERPSSHLYLLFIVLIGSSILFMSQLVYDALLSANPVLLVAHGGVVVALLLAAAFVYTRRPWGLAVTLLALALALLSALTSRSDPDAVMAMLRRGATNGGVTLLLDLVAGGVQTSIKPLQIVAAVGGFFYALLIVSSDFQRVRERLVARIDKGISEAGAYYAAGKRHAAAGRWASAVLHWQRAAANAPGRVAYYRTLADGYASLGHRRRSQDALRAGLRVATNPAQREEFEKRLTALEERITGAADSR